VAHEIPGIAKYLEFHYKIVRVWEKPLAEVLEGGIGMLPMAPLTDGAKEALPATIHRMEERFHREIAPAEAAKLWAATYVLMGLRYPKELTAQLLQGVRGMKESVTYQAILAEGEARGEARGEAKGRAQGLTEGLKALRNALLALGEKQFGAPDQPTRTAVEAIADPVRLERLLERVLDVSTWAELLNPPPRPNGKRKRKS
jgi:hypothetical protein